ncbi:MAG: NFACT RNA binding domain-containing protein [Ignavibacterium sp.]|nr:NFACT RNA binding domain-containing protein [Ignavibacterium sp.]MDW8374331.1 NFACT RNA binding domain-containing protein [Ignavibacteriales bacterium]
MIKNYFFLSRLAAEISSLIKDALIQDIYTAEKNKLTINLFNSSEFTLEFCVNHTLPYVIKRNYQPRKKRNSKDIFPEVLNLKFTNTFIAKNDRVILFQIENQMSLFFTVRGKFTNLYLLNGENFTSFKKVPDYDLSNLKEEFLKLEFVSPLTIPEININDIQNFEELKKRYPFISEEITSKFESFKNFSLDEYESVVKKIFYDNFLLSIDEKEGKLEVDFNYNKEIKNSNSIEFNSALEILITYLHKLDYFEKCKSTLKEINKHLIREISNLEKKKDNLLLRIKSGSKEKFYRKLAELLLINKSKLTTGLNEIIVNDIFSDNNELKISLNKKLTPQENIEYYFKKAKEEKIFFERSEKIIGQIENRLQQLNNIKSEIINCKELNELYSIAKKLGIKTEQNSMDKIEDKIKFRHYKIDNKYNVYVGKDSKSNDLLTLKFSRQNDLWFHARAVSGSHVVLKVENKNEPIPKSVIKKVASIAAFYSKAKTSSLVPVSFTFRKYVVKRKGMEPGQVALLREETILVKPEIPTEAVYVEKED